MAEAMEISLSGAWGASTRGAWDTEGSGGVLAVEGSVCGDCGGSWGGSGVLAQAARRATSPRPLSNRAERPARLVRTDNEE